MNRENNQYKALSVKEYNEYKKFLFLNKIYPESILLSLFSGMFKSHSYGECIYCKTTIDNLAFSYFIDLNIYLDDINYIFY